MKSTTVIQSKPTQKDVGHQSDFNLLTANLTIMPVSSNTGTGMVGCSSKEGVEKDEIQEKIDEIVKKEIGQTIAPAQLEKDK